MRNCDEVEESLSTVYSSDDKYSCDDTTSEVEV